MNKEDKLFIRNLFLRNLKIIVAILLISLVLLVLYWGLSGQEIPYVPPINEPKKCTIPVPVPVSIPETVPSPEQADDSEYIENVIVLVIIYTATFLFLVFVPDWTIYDDK